MPENHAEPDRAGGSALLDITVRTGTGSGRTLLSAFDHALLDAGVANFNLVTLSSVIPQNGRFRLDRTRLACVLGVRLF